MIRLDKLLSDMGAGTRNTLKKEIRKGKVMVNGVVEKNPGAIIDETTAHILFDTKEVVYQKHWYFMMHKPAGTLCISDCALSVLNLIKEPYKGLFCVGRLDKDTEGLLLITNDGHLSHELLAPKKHVNKVYEVHLDSPISQSAITMLEQGVSEGGDQFEAAKVEVLQEQCVLLTIHEGKYHQVKRMFSAVGNHVRYLKRIQMKNLVLDDSLAPGEYRELTPAELADLQA